MLILLQFWQCYAIQLSSLMPNRMHSARARAVSHTHALSLSCTNDAVISINTAVILLRITQAIHTTNRLQIKQVL